MGNSAKRRERYEVRRPVPSGVLRPLATTVTFAVTIASVSGIAARSSAQQGDLSHPPRRTQADASRTGRFLPFASWPGGAITPENIRDLLAPPIRIAVSPPGGSDAAEAAALERARPALIRAIISGDTTGAERLLTAGADPNVRDLPGEDRMTPLMHAALRGQTRLCAALLSRGAKLSGKDDHGYTALTYAARDGQQETFDLLLARGAYARGIAGGQALVFAAREGSLPMVKRLLAVGAPRDRADPEDENITALIRATLREDAAMATVLLDAGARVDVADVYGRSALTWACIGGDDGMARLLLARGASVNRNDGVALTLAIRNGRVSTVRLLLSYGAAVTPAHRDEAGKKGNRELIALLKGA